MYQQDVHVLAHITSVFRLLRCSAVPCLRLKRGFIGWVVRISPRVKGVESAAVVFGERQSFVDASRKIGIRDEVTPECDGIDGTSLNDLFRRIWFESSCSYQLSLEDLTQVF